jgi:hypothetical protein
VIYEFPEHLARLLRVEVELGPLREIAAELGLDRA